MNGPPDSLASVLKLANEIPSLRIVIDHLANVRIDGQAVGAAWERDMQALSELPEVYAKVSGLVEAGARAKRPAPVDTEYYAKHLDVIWDAFGEDRLVYGSNWPVSGLYAPLLDVQRTRVPLGVHTIPVIQSKRRVAGLLDLRNDQPGSDRMDRPGGYEDAVAHAGFDAMQALFRGATMYLAFQGGSQLSV